MAKQDIIVIGASAGGFAPLMELVKGLSRDFSGSVFVVMHVPPYTESKLPQLLTRSGQLKAVHPKDGEPIRQGMIYVAPADHHMIIEGDRILIKKGPKENRFRPSIDALFRSAAYQFGPRVIGIVLSGLLDDGTSGLWTIKRLGGTAIIQALEEAEHDSMPRSVLEYVEVDHQLPVSEMSSLLDDLTNKTVSKKSDVPKNLKDLLKTEITISAQDNAFEMGIMEMGELTPFTCPECHGVLVQLKEKGVIRFRCHTGHAFSASALLAGITENSEDQIWQVIRGMEESIMLLNKMGEHFKERKATDAANEFFKRAKAIGQQARSLRSTLFAQEQLSADAMLNGREVKSTNGKAKSTTRKSRNKT